MSWSAAPILGCTDVRRTAEWYRDVLGFTLDPENGIFDGVDENEGAVYAIVSRAGQGIHLQIRRGRPPVPPRADREPIETDVYVYVDDVDALYAEYSATDVTVFRPLEDEPYGMRDFAIEDVEGHRLAFGSPIPA